VDCASRTDCFCCSSYFSFCFSLRANYSLRDFSLFMDCFNSSIRTDRCSRSFAIADIFCYNSLAFVWYSLISFYNNSLFPSALLILSFTSIISFYFNNISLSFSLSFCSNSFVSNYFFLDSFNRPIDFCSLSLILALNLSCYSTATFS